MQSQIEYIELADEDEVRKWMNKEIARLGRQFDGFEITWSRDESKHWLEIWSKVKGFELNGPSGLILRIGEALTDEDWQVIPIIQAEGRKLYYKLRKEYRVKRNLGLGD